MHLGERDLRWGWVGIEQNFLEIMSVNFADLMGLETLDCSRLEIAKKVSAELKNDLYSLAVI